MRPRLAPSVPSALLVLLLAAGLAADATARGSNVHTFTQTQDVSDGSGGPWLTGHVYLVMAAITVPAGQTLTVQPGAIVKFDSGRLLSVKGTLHAVGTSGAPIRFTSLKDDAVGGDHNGDGAASVPAKGDWRRIELSSSATACVMRWCRVRYAGQSGARAVDCATSGFTMTDCVIEDGLGPGLDLTVAAGPIERNAFDRCKRAVTGMTPKWLDTLRDNTASGNVEGDRLRVDGAGTFGTTLTSDTTWAPANSMNGTGEIELYRPILLLANRTLTVEAGTSLLFTSSTDVLDLDGDLVTNGTATDPVVLTSAADAQYGGSGAAPGDWFGVRLVQSAGSALTHTEIRYAGKSGGAVRLSQSDAVFVSCTFAHSATDGLDAGGSAPTVTGCDFVSNAEYPISPVPIDVLAGFSGNTATGNGFGDAVALGGGDLDAAFSLGPAPAFNGTGAFILSGTITVGTSGSLTLASGVVLKADPSTHPEIRVFGVLSCDGQAGAEVVLTSLRDDTHGGDLNADGAATSPASGDWDGVKLFQSSDASTLKHTRIRYAGRNGLRSLLLDGSDAALTSCVIEHGGGPALEAKNAAPTVTGCAFDSCAGAAPVIELPLESVAGLTANTAQGNANGDSLRFAASTVSGALTVKKENALNGDGVFVFDGTAAIASGGAMTVQAGVTFKFASDDALWVSGTLTAIGTDLERIGFTSLADDHQGIDTGNDGPTTGTPGDWEGILVTLSGDVVLSYVDVRFPGANGEPGLALDGGVATLDHVAIEDAAAYGLRQLTPSGGAVVTNSAFDRCVRPVSGTSIASLAGWAANTAQGNTQGDVIRFLDCGPGSSMGLTAGQSLNGTGAFVSIGFWNVNGSKSVTLGPGVTVKVAHAQPIVVSGTLFTEGTAAAPVCFTSPYDDAYGGDSNGDGAATSPAPGDWVGLEFRPSSDASTLTHTFVRYAGLGGAAGIDLDQADVTLCDVTIENGAGPGIDANGNSAPTLKDVSIDDNGGLAIEGVTWGLLGKLSGASASGNQGGDYSYIDSPTIGGDLTIHREGVLGACIVVNVTPNTNSGSLSFGRGVIVKATGPHVEMKVKDVLGTGLEKVVFTSFHDDDHGGDSDAAATAPSAGDWIGVSSNGSVEHALIRYAGADPGGGTRAAGLRGVSTAGRCVGTRVEHSAGDGFDILAHASGLVAFQNAGAGIRAPVVRASTAYGNGDFGFAGDWGIAGGALSIAYECISWMNGPNLVENYQYSGDHTLVPPGVDVVWSCGTALGVGPPTGFGGVNCGSTGWGNLHADPRFVDGPNGDLRLKADSPCRNYVRVPCPPSILNDASLCTPWGSGGLGYPGPPTAPRDHVEAPRSVDDDQVGPAPKLADLGAYERAVWTLAPIGDPILGGFVPLHCVGPAGVAFYLLGFDGDDAYLDPYGFLCFDPAFVLSLAALPVGTPLVLPVLDDPILDGLEVSIQAAVQGASGALETTNVWRPRFHR